jgi:hypothetical protein
MMKDEMQAPLPKPTLQASTAITATDHGQIVVLASCICLAIGILLSIARVYVRWPLNVMAGKDDLAYAVAMCLATAQTAITINAVQRGFGKVESELSEWQVVNTSKVSTISSRSCAGRKMKPGERLDSWNMFVRITR